MIKFWKLVTLKDIWHMKTEWESELNDVILAPPRSLLQDKLRQIKTRWCSCWKRWYFGICCFRHMKKLFKKLLKFLIIDETYNVSSNIDWSRKVHTYAAIQVIIWWIKHTWIAKQRPSSLMSCTKLWQPSLHPHTSHAIERPTTITYSEINNTFALVCY